MKRRTVVEIETTKEAYLWTKADRAEMFRSLGFSKETIEEDEDGTEYFVLCQEYTCPECVATQVVVEIEVFDKSVFHPIEGRDTGIETNKVEINVYIFPAKYYYKYGEGRIYRSHADCVVLQDMKTHLFPTDDLMEYLKDKFKEIEAQMWNIFGLKRTA